MGYGFKQGSASSGNLNYYVKAYPSEEALPATEKENTIALFTDTPITSKYFSPEAPTGEEGMVWIQTGTTSPVEFNALKKNILMVYPIVARQYVNGTWVERQTKSFLNGKWAGWWNGYLFDYGNEYTDYTGGFIKKNNYGSGASVVHNADGSIELVPPGGESTGGCIYYTANKIDLTNYTTLHMYGKIWDYNKWTGCGYGVYSNIGSTSEENRVAYVANYQHHQNMEYTLDISELTGKFHIAAWIQGHRNYDELVICKLWLT